MVLLYVYTLLIISVGHHRLLNKEIYVRGGFDEYCRQEANTSASRLAFLRQFLVD